MFSASTAIAPPWETIDTVLLDMDGTLLDLKFDNFFWQELIPEAYATRRGLNLQSAKSELAPRFERHRGQLAWYCTDFWSRELDLPVAELKEAAAAHVAWLEGAEMFLQQVRQLGKRMLLVTNAHTDTLRIKEARTDLGRYFDALVSSHTLGSPKEHEQFWTRLNAHHPFDPKRTLFVDDSLPVLRAAREYGIAHIIAVTHPDSSQDPRLCDEFASVHRVQELLGT